VPGDTHLIFDFSEPGDEKAWQSVDDVVMGGVSSSILRVDSEDVAIFEGNVSLEQGGGFASVGSRPRVRDLSDCDGLRVRVRGDGQRYRLRLSTGIGAERISYQARLQTEHGVWQKEDLPFDLFEPRYHGRPLPDAPPLDARNITSFGWLIADGQAGPFRLEIDWIGAYVEEDC